MRKFICLLRLWPSGSPTRRPSLRSDWLLFLQVCVCLRVSLFVMNQVVHPYDQAAFSVRGAAAVLNFPVDRVQESLRTLALGAAGVSPVLALKCRHSIRKRSPNKNKKTTNHKQQLAVIKEAVAVPQPPCPGVVELEDLGADYLEELLWV